MKTTLLAIIAACGGLLFTGCAQADTGLAPTDGLGEFALALAGREPRDLYPVERISGGSGKIATGHARKDVRGVLVSGYVEKLGPGEVTAAWSHVDVVVLDSKGRPSQRVATRFFPTEVPSTQRGITGRSGYSVILPSLPPVGSTVQVAFHQTPITQCESAQK